jgi:hypothetical protein
MEVQSTNLVSQIIPSIIKIWHGTALCGDGAIMLPFSIVSGGFGIGSLWLDGLAVILLKRNALYSFNHGFRTFYLAPLWFLASSITAAMGFAVQIYEPTMYAAFLASAFWYLFLKQALPSGEDNQDDK